PTKISGTCGRLMCCLKYEQDAYEYLLKNTPKVGAYVKTPDFKGYVEEVNLLTGKLKVKPEKSEDAAVIFDKADVTVIRDGKIKIDKEELKALKELEDK
ncbi:MAG: stage 0 sporulation protein, partial [Oscillospiraceae bacterium]